MTSKNAKAISEWSKTYADLSEDEKQRLGAYLAEFARACQSLGFDSCNRTDSELLDILLERKLIDEAILAWPLQVDRKRPVYRIGPEACYFWCPYVHYRDPASGWVFAYINPEVLSYTRTCIVRFDGNIEWITPNELRKRMKACISEAREQLQNVGGPDHH